MKNRTQPGWLWLILTFILCLGQACSDKNEADDNPHDSDYYYDGEIRFVNFHRKMTPGVYECYFTNRSDGSELVVAAIVYSEEGEVVFIPESPVRTGEYYFNRAVLVETDQAAAEEEVGHDIPLGCMVSVTSTSCSFEEGTVDENLECYGSGTKEDPYRISSYVHLENLMTMVNSTEENNKKYGDKYYIQTANISLKVPCATLNSGWNSIGNHITRPFAGHYDGQGYKIKNMTVKRRGNVVPQPSGLFGIIIGSSISGVKMESSTIESDFAVAGMLVGSVVSTGNMRLTSGLKNCSVANSCKIKAPYFVGGLVGGVNQNARLVMSGCTNNMEVAAEYQGVGGLIGAAFVASTVTLDGCSNTAEINGNSGIVGGLVGSADTLIINDCKNSGKIIGGSSSIGTGGLVGGGLNVHTSFSENRGTVRGYREVGGIIGSAARNSSQKIYGNTHIYSSGNYGDIYGRSEVGGLVGAAQILVSGSYNFATVEATRKNVGGLAGLGAMAIILGSSNDGRVLCSGSDADGFTGGVIGSAQDYLITGSNNFGDVSNNNGKGTVGGIMGGCDMLGVISYCGNFGDIKAADGSAGGIIGRAGKPKTMTDKMIADMVIGTAVGIVSIGLSAASIPGEKSTNPKLKNQSRQMGIAGKVINAFISANDLSWTVANNVLKESDITEERMKQLEYNANRKLESNHYNRIGCFHPGDGESTLDLFSAMKHQVDLQEKFITRITDKDSKYEDNVNDWRDDVEDKMHSKEEAREVAGHVGEAIAFAGDILGFCPVPNPVGIVMSAIVTIYNFVMNLTDYSYNRVGILQSYNYGIVQGGDNYYAGGIAGELHDYARIFDSANLVRIEGEQAGSLFGKGGHLPAVEGSVNLQTQGIPFYRECVFSSTVKNNFDISGSSKDVHDMNTYSMLDFNERWTWVTDGISLPMIWKSQFE